MISFSFTQLAEILGIAGFTGSVVIYVVNFLLGRQKTEIVNSFRHEIDRLAIEQNQIQCHLEKTTNYKRLFFSGVWREIFNQQCHYDE